LTNLVSDIIFRPAYRLLRNILFWVVYFVATACLTITDYSSVRVGLLVTLLFTPLNIAYTYLFVYGLVPRLLLRGKTRKFLVWSIVCVLLSQGFIFLFRHLVISQVNIESDWPEPGVPILRQVFDFSVALVTNMVALFAVFISVFKYWSREQQKKMLLEQERTSNELELLKAQLQPHFLFNTLKNLHAMVREKSEKAPDMLMRLSSLLNYVLYECKASEVPLEKEIRVIKDYIALEQKRYGERLDVSLSFTGPMEGKMIAPMLFQPFVENAFAHDPSGEAGRIWMSIELSIKNDQLFFRVVNSLYYSDSGPGTEGMGVSNVRRRLELLYPGRFSLDQEAVEEVYITSLIIELSPAGAFPRRLPARVVENNYLSI
jgi:two-component system, LytTR family, sensor kinase